MTHTSDALMRLTATEAVALLKRHEITPLELIAAAERRIAEVEPAINALPTLAFERARAHARRLMRGEGRAAEGEAGWLAGLPVAIKDLVDVAGVRTTYGSLIFKDHVPATSHPLVERIERKGGIIIAKSNTPEFGAGGSTFNEVFGRTRNPWNTSLTPGGSTGGGAAALAGRGVAGARNRSRRQFAPPRHLLLPRGDAALGWPRHARHCQQPIRTALGARAHGSHSGRRGAVPRHHGRALPSRSAHVCGPEPFVQRCHRQAHGPETGRLHSRLWR
jgi:hypothetical protein